MIPLPALPLFRDWYIFYQAGKAMQSGISPYLVEGFLNPIQVAWLLSLTTFVPFLTWVYLMCAAAFILIVALNKKKSHWALLSMPFIFGLTMGSLDVFLWVPSRLLGGWGLPLMTLKPQLGIFVIPLQLATWWRERNFTEIKRFFGVLVVLWGVPFLAQPTWLQAWLDAVSKSNSVERMHWAASIAGFSAVTGGEWFYLLTFAIVLGILLFRDSKSFYLAGSFAPSLWPSDWILASEFVTWRFTLLSWALVPTGLSTNGAQFYFLLGFLIWAEQNPERTRASLARLKELFGNRMG